MIINPYRFGSGPPPAVQTVLSAVNIAPSLTMINSNLVEANTTNAGLVLSDSGKTSGKYYAEIRCPQIATTAQSLAMGLRRSTGSLTNYLGQTANGWGTWAEGAGGATRSTYNNATQDNVFVGAVTANGQTARIAVDIDAGQLWLSRFGNTAWIGGGDPAAGTSPTYTFTPAGDTFYLALNPRTGGTLGSGTRLQLILPGSWSSSAPSGFGVWTA